MCGNFIMALVAWLCGVGWCFTMCCWVPDPYGKQPRVAVTDMDKKARGGMTAFVVERNSPGVTVGKKEKNMGQRASDTRSINFEEVEVPDANVVGQVGDGWRLAMAAFDYTRPAVSCAAVGLARAAMEHSIQYAGERRAFGVPIAAHQAVSFMIADMAKDIEAGRLLCWKAAWLKDAGNEPINVSTRPASVGVSPAP